MDAVDVRVPEGTDVFSDPPGTNTALSIQSGGTTNRGGAVDTLVVASGGAPFTDDGTVIQVENYGALVYAGFDVVEVRDAFDTAAEPVAEAVGLRLAARPNPAAGALALALTLDAPGPVAVAVVDMLGRTVSEVWGGPLAAGEHVLTWDAAGVAPGVYAVRVEAGGQGAAVLVTVVR